MDPATYYTNTLVNAAKNLGPPLLFIIAGYFFFIKLPFLLMMRVNKENRKEEKDSSAMGPVNEVPPQLKSSSTQQSETNQSQAHKSRPHKESQEAPKNHRKRPHPTSAPDPLLALFNFHPGAPINRKELKKRYHQLLRENHPDKVAAQGHAKNKLAEKRTKEINQAYEELKKRAS
jgi:hypothetical protein